MKACQKIDQVKEVLYLRGSDLDSRKACQHVVKSVKAEKVVSLPSLEPVFVHIRYYKRGAKNCSEPLTHLVQGLEFELQEQIQKNLGHLLICQQSQMPSQNMG